MEFLAGPIQYALSRSENSTAIFAAAVIPSSTLTSKTRKPSKCGLVPFHW
jgi:hypothetical protein